jgi:hypothetical protein
MNPWEKASTKTTFAAPEAPQPFAVANPQAIRGQIRGALNREFGFVKPAEEAPLSSERELLVGLLHDLYLITAEADMLPLVSHSDIIETAAIIQRLQLIGHRDSQLLLGYCRRRSLDGERNLNFCDPLQRRHLLCYAGNVAGNPFMMGKMTELEEILAQDDSNRLNAWFEQVTVNLDKLPKDVPALLRRYLLRFAESGKSCIASFSHQLAILDVRLLGPLGWENSRAFHVLLKRFGAAKCDYLSNYLSHDELREAIALYQGMGNMAVVEHFEFLYSSFNPQLLDSVKETIFEASRKPASELRSSINRPPSEAQKDGKTAPRSWLRIGSWLRAGS